MAGGWQLGVDGFNLRLVWGEAMNLTYNEAVQQVGTGPTTLGIHHGGCKIHPKPHGAFPLLAPPVGFKQSMQE